MVDRSPSVAIPIFDAERGSVARSLENRRPLLRRSHPCPLLVSSKQEGGGANCRDHRASRARWPAEMGVEESLASASPVEREAREWLGVRFGPECLGPRFAAAAEIDRGPVSAGEEDPRLTAIARADQEQQCCKKDPHRNNPSERVRPPEPCAFTPLQALHCYWTG